MNRHYVWITMLTASYAGMICGKLVKNGFAVQPLNDTVLVLGSKDNPSVIMGICLDHREGKSAGDILKEVKRVLADLKVKYHSVVITGLDLHDHGNTQWSGSNISLKEIEDTKTKKVQQRSHLRLVPQPKESEPKPELPT